MENVYSALNEVIECITNSSDYKKCISLKNKMSENEEITSLIKKIKDTQKKYVRSGYDSKIKVELDALEKELMNIPIYYVYSKSLEKVNQMIDYVKDELNDYFSTLLNQ